MVAAALGGIIWVSAGDLNPPAGPITPTMKTLAEVEPRTPIRAADLPKMINESGSYYLAENISTTGGGITISVSDVTLDLMGFTLKGATGIGISVSVAATNIKIHNGTITGWKGGSVNAQNANDSRFENLSAFGAIAGVGISVGNHCEIEHCKVGGAETGLTGLTYCVVRDTIVHDIVGDQAMVFGNNAKLERCISSNNDLEAIQVGKNSQLIDCIAENTSGGGGFVLGANSSAEGCIARNNSGAGFQLTTGSTLINCTSVGNAAMGIHITGPGNRIANNVVMRNGDNYDIAAGNQINILLCEIPESIDWPANVTLAGSLNGTVDVNGLTINADDVTIDLAGHALIGAGGTLGYGIFMNGQSNVEIRNGTIRDFGLHCIRELGLSGRNHRVIGVRVVSNGQGSISLGGEGHLVKDCTAEGNGIGIFTSFGSTVTGNMAIGNTGVGIFTGDGCTVTGNTARNNLRGIITGDGCTVIGNTAYSNSSFGISTGDGNTVTGNTAYFNSQHGISLGGNSLVDQNTALNNDLSGGGYSNMTLCLNCTFGVNHAP